MLTDIFKIAGLPSYGFLNTFQLKFGFENSSNSGTFKNEIVNNNPLDTRIQEKWRREEKKYVFGNFRFCTANMNLCGLYDAWQHFEL